MLLAQPAQQEMTVSMDSSTANLHLQFVSAPKKPTDTPQPQPQPQPADSAKTQSKEVDKKTETNRSIEVTKTPPKPVKSQSKVEMKNNKKSKTAPTAETKPPVEEIKTSQPADKPFAKPLENPTDADKPSESTNNLIGTSAPTTPKLMQKPTFKAKPTPVTYPRLAKRRGQQGKVLVEVWINDKGDQIKHFIVDSSGFSSLDSAALTAIANWKFDVSTEQGYAIAHRVQIPVNFTLDR